MKRRMFLFAAGLGALVLVVSACGDDSSPPDNPSPTAPVTASPTVIAAAPTLTPGGPTRTPFPTVPPTITPTDTAPAPPPTDPPPPTETPGPFEHVIQPGDDCIGIAYQYGHRVFNQGVLDIMARLNNLASCNMLPGPGTTILVPRPTFTPTPAGMDMTQTIVATSAPPMITLDAPASIAVQSYVVRDGDTLSSIAIMNDSSLRQLCELNPLPEGIDCGGCRWESAHCCCPSPPLLSVGQSINVPAPTPTPTLTPTFTGSETPTLTPTHRAPEAVFPVDGATVAGPVRLAWLTAGKLADEETYLVTLRDDTAGEVFSTTTRRLSVDVPQDFLPLDGEARTFTWQVTVGRVGEDGLFYPTGGTMPERHFIWRGWE